MTTIAWDGKTLAADRLLCDGSMTSIGRKIFKLDDGRFYAFSGQIQVGYAVMNWLNNKRDKPTVKEDSFAAFVVGTDGALSMLEDQLIECPCATPYAIGGGRDFAMAAMFLGKTAQEAILVAAHFSATTGGGVDEFLCSQA